MATKLTLRMDEALIKKAKEQAARRGKSVSQMFGEYVKSLDAAERKQGLPPLTAKLVGIMKGQSISEEDYKTHLRDKYL